MLRIIKIASICILLFSGSAFADGWGHRHHHGYGGYGYGYSYTPYYGGYAPPPPVYYPAPQPYYVQPPVVAYGGGISLAPVVSLPFFGGEWGHHHGHR